MWKTFYQAAGMHALSQQEIKETEKQRSFVPGSF
jgi:hypothetical protein